MAIVRKADVRNGLTAALLLVIATAFSACAGDLTAPTDTTEVMWSAAAAGGDGGEGDDPGKGKIKCILVEGVLLCD